MTTAEATSPSVERLISSQENRKTSIIKLLNEGVSSPPVERKITSEEIFTKREIVSQLSHIFLSTSDQKFSDSSNSTVIIETNHTEFSWSEQEVDNQSRSTSMRTKPEFGTESPPGQLPPLYFLLGISALVLLLLLLLSLILYIRHILSKKLKQVQLPEETELTVRTVFAEGIIPSLPPLYPRPLRQTPMETPLRLT